MTAADPLDLLVLAPGWRDELFMPLRFERHLGLAYLVAWLRAHDIRVDQLVEARPLTVREAVDRIEQREARCVGFTVHDTTFHLVRCLAREIRRRRPDLPIIAGGPTATFSDRLILETEPAIDLCVRGEGEETTRELLDALLHGRALDCIAGISWRQGGRVRRTADRPLLRGLDPQAGLDIFPSPYLTKLLPADDDIGILTSRGCGQHCSYCNFSAMSGGQVSHHSVERVVTELRLIASSRPAGRPWARRVSILDDMFTVDQERTRALCRRLIEEQLDLQYWCQTRADALDAETIDLLVQAGVRAITFGLESAVPANLRTVRKVGRSQGANGGEEMEEAFVEAVRRGAVAARERGLQVSVSIITGMPGQTAAEANRTLDFVESLRLPLYYHDYLILYPGTELFEHRQEHGLGLSVPATRLPGKTVFAFDVAAVRVLPNAMQQLSILRATADRLAALFGGRWPPRPDAGGVEAVLAGPGDALQSVVMDTELSAALTLSPLVVTVDSAQVDRRPELVRLVEAGLPVINLVCLAERIPDESAREAGARIFDIRLLTEVVERRRLELVRTGGLAFLPLGRASHLGLLRATPALDYVGSAVLLTCCERSDVAAFSSLLADPDPLLAARQQLGLDCELADACRWRDGGCPLAEGRVLTLLLGGGEVVPAGCLAEVWETPVLLGGSAPTRSADRALTQRRGCASCAVQETCCRCPRPDPFTEPEFCEIRRSGSAARLLGRLEWLDRTQFVARFRGVLG